MAKSRVSDKTRYRQKRGTGRGKQYGPWIEVPDVSSIGRSHRVFWDKTERIHHFLSDIEELFFWICIWDEKIIDIREQFPLLPQVNTLYIAECFGYKHPAIPVKNQDIVMTTDFVITKLIEGREINFARSVKMTRDLLSTRTREKLAIERQYWVDKDVDWALVTENSFSLNMAKNIKRLSNIKEWVDGMNIDKTHLDKIYMTLMEENIEKIDAIFIATEMDKHHGYELGTFLNLVKYLIWTKQIVVDMKREILDYSNLRILKGSRNG